MLRTNILMTLLFLLVSVLFSQNTIISTTWGPPSTADEWQKFSISLTADEFDISDSDFADVMANVQRIRIQTESHSGYDVGSIDQVRVGDRFSSTFDSGLDGWNAHGDGTLNWIENGGMSNSGHIAIHDWARGDWHYAVAPAEWSGDWSGLIGSSFEFYYKSDYPDAATVLEISSEFEKRIILNATPLITPQNTSSKVKVSLNEIPNSDVEISLSSENGCFQVPSSVIIPAGDEYTEFDATVPEDAETGCTSAIEASASGYVPARLILTVGESAGGGGTAKLCGQVTDATNGEGIAGAVVTVADLSAVTDDNGNYCIENVPTDIVSANFFGEPRSGPAPLTVQFNDLSGTGSPTITASAENYSTFRSTVSLSAGEEKTLDISLSPGITDAEMRIVLNWGENPRDLDLHLLVPGDATHSPYHMYFDDKGEQESFPYAFLDHDDRYSYGPETITLGTFISGTYKFYVHKYAGTGDLTASEAVVQIYNKSGLVNTVNVPVSGTGDYWAVGEIDGRTGQVLINSVIQEEEPSLSGMSAKLQKRQVKSSFSAAAITSWAWYFNNDGVIDSNSENPSWIYHDAGDYTVSLTVSDGTNSYTETKTNYITVTGESYSDDAYHVSITSIDATNFPLVKTFVSVIDTATGNPLGELPNSAFDITENGMTVSEIVIEKLSISSGAKADIAFIFDTTGSMEGVMNTLKNRCLVFADSLAAKGVDYRLGLVTFADEVLSIHDFTSDAREFKTWIEGLSATGGGDSKENALEAIESAAGLSYREVAQRVTILITDADYHEAGESGDGTTDFTTESLVSFLNDRNILCNVVGPDMPQHKIMAKQTRGYYYRIQDDFSDIIDRIGDQISNQYVTTFVPNNTTPDNTYRTVKVAIDHDGKSGQDRASYYVGSTKLVSHPPVVIGLKRQRFTLDIYVQNIMNLSAAKYYLTYDKTKVKAVNVLSGEFMSSSGASETFIYDIVHDSGKVEINQSRLVQSGSTESISGSGHLATVEFEVLVDECTSSIDFYGLDFRQLNGESIHISATGSQVKSAGVAGASSSILCDFDKDLDIDTRDFSLLGTYWKPVNNSLGDVGPATGAVPLLTSAPDGKVDFEDLFTFTRMWNWYYLSLGTSGTALAKENGTLSWDLINDKNVLQMNVKIQNVSDLAMGHIIFYYNDAALSVKHIEQGEVLTTADASSGLISDINQAGIVDVAFSKLAHINQSATLDPSGVLFSVFFEKTGHGGQAGLELGSVDLRSRNNQPLQVYHQESDDLSFETVPATFQLTNYPNPFNNRTKIQYQLPKETHVDIQIINILGQPVRVLVRKRMDAGEYEIHWDGKNNTGVDVMSGMYMLKMTAGDQTLVRKLLFLK